MILHLCSDYDYTEVYPNLLRALTNLGLKQIMYVPQKSEVGNLSNSNIEPYNVIHSQDFNQLDRILYHRKVNKINTNVNKHVDLKKVGLVHAHFLFSMGGCAIELKRKNGIKYVVSVRSTDLFQFFPKALHLRKHAIRILLNSSAIHFLSPSYKEILLNRYIPERFKDEIERKSQVIPNGLNDFWIHNIGEPKCLKGSITILFVGEFNKNKNLIGTIKAVKALRDNGLNVVLKAVGRDSNSCNSVVNFAIKNHEFVTIIDRISNKNDLLQEYKSADIFILPSFIETFGLAFTEAMSQGLPIIYTKGQGIDGYFLNGHVGYQITPTDISSIVRAISATLQNYEQLSKNCIDEVSRFSWSKIASEHLKVYNTILQ